MHGTHLLSWLSFHLPLPLAELPWPPSPLGFCLTGPQLLLQLCRTISFDKNCILASHNVICGCRRHPVHKPSESQLYGPQRHLLKSALPVNCQFAALTGLLIRRYDNSINFPCGLVMRTCIWASSLCCCRTSLLSSSGCHDAWLSFQKNVVCKEGPSHLARGPSSAREHMEGHG